MVGNGVWKECIACAEPTNQCHRFEEGDLPCHNECFEDLCGDLFVDHERREDDPDGQGE